VWKSRNKIIDYLISEFYKKEIHRNEERRGV
jgi:hypothetical protein